MSSYPNPKKTIGGDQPTDGDAPSFPTLQLFPEHRQSERDDAAILRRQNISSPMGENPSTSLDISLGSFQNLGGRSSGSESTLAGTITNALSLPLFPELTHPGRPVPISGNVSSLFPGENPSMSLEITSPSSLNLDGLSGDNKSTPISKKSLSLFPELTNPGIFSSVLPVKNPSMSLEITSPSSFNLAGLASPITQPAGGSSISGRLSSPVENPAMSLELTSHSSLNLAGMSDSDNTSAGVTKKSLLMFTGMTQPAVRSSISGNLSSVSREENPSLTTGLSLSLGGGNASMTLFSGLTQPTGPSSMAAGGSSSLMPEGQSQNPLLSSISGNRAGNPSLTTGLSLSLGGGNASMTLFSGLTQPTGPSSMAAGGSSSLMPEGPCQNPVLSHTQEIAPASVAIRERALPLENKNPIIEPPFDWATNERAHVFSVSQLRTNRVRVIRTELECVNCEYKRNVEYYYYDIEAMIGRCEGMNPEMARGFLETTPLSCPVCRKMAVYPVVAPKKRLIDWLGLFTYGGLGLLTIKQLVYFLKHNNIDWQDSARQILLSQVIREIARQARP